MKSDALTMHRVHRTNSSAARHRPVPHVAGGVSTRWMVLPALLGVAIVAMLCIQIPISNEAHGAQSPLRPTKAFRRDQPASVPSAVGSTTAVNSVASDPTSDEAQLVSLARELQLTVSKLPVGSDTTSIIDGELVRKCWKRVSAQGSRVKPGEIRVNLQSSLWRLGSQDRDRDSPKVRYSIAYTPSVSDSPVLLVDGTVGVSRVFERARVQTLAPWTSQQDKFTVLVVE